MMANLNGLRSLNMSHTFFLWPSKHSFMRQSKFTPSTFTSSSCRLWWSFCHLTNITFGAMSKVYGNTSSKPVLYFFHRLPKYATPFTFSRCPEESGEYSHQSRFSYSVRNHPQRYLYQFCRDLQRKQFEGYLSKYNHSSSYRNTIVVYESTTPDRRLG